MVYGRAVWMVVIVAAMMGFQRDFCEGLLTVVWMVA